MDGDLNQDQLEPDIPYQWKIRSIEWQRLKMGRTASVAGSILQGLPTEKIRKGDLYVAERNSGLKLLTAREDPTEELNCIHPTTNEYSYDLWECVKVVEAEKLNGID